MAIDKDRPVSLEPDDPIRVALERTAAGDIDRDLVISLRVAGGMPSQAYRLDYRIGGDLRARVALDDNRANRRREADNEEVDRDQLTEVARELVANGVLDVPTVRPRFLPDTVVGIIEISNGERSFRVYFAADPDQASVQEEPPRAELQRAAAAIYASAGGLMGERSVGP